MGEFLKGTHPIPPVDNVVGELDARAKGGDAKAMRILGDFYRDGKATQKDLKKAISYYEQALAHGDKGVLNNLGEIYYRSGDELGFDAKNALGYYQRGVDNGDRWAMAGLGDVYREGKLIKHDISKALSLYQKAADLGNNSVLARIGDIYHRNGDELGLDAQKAIGFYQKGVDNGDRWAMAGLGDVYREGKLIKQDVPKAIELYQRAAELGNSAAYVRLGDLHRSGATFGLDPAKAVAFYQKGIDSRESWAMIGLGDMYREGNAVPQDLRKALELYQAALGLKNTAVLTKLGELYYRNGSQINLDQSLALDFYRRGADRGDTWSMMGLGDVYREGRIVTKNEKQALSYYRTALKAGNQRAYAAVAGLLLNGSRVEQAEGLSMVKEGIAKGLRGLTPLIADAYLHGKGVKADPKKAITILKKASEGGDSFATLRLLQIYTDGYNGGSRALKSARALLIQTADQFTPDRLAIERLSIEGTAAKSKSQMMAFATELKALPPSSQAAIVSRVAWRNENAFVYALQALMKDQGVYNGQLDGMLTSSTISSLYGECIKVASQRVCQAGPLSREGRITLNELFRARGAN
ncbi:TPR repeat [Rhizobium sp. RU20A]|nr:TPR repeat [Rhizobium sp. RU20A]